MGSGVKKLKDSSSILADELHEPVIKKFNKRKVYSQFKDNIWGVALADMQSLSKKSKSIKYLLCTIDLYSKYAFVVPLKHIIMYSTYNESKSVVAERFIRTLKNKLYKHMTATGKNVYYDVLDDIVNEYNNTKHNTIKMKPKDVGYNNKRVYIYEHNEKSARYNVGDRVRISKFKNIFAKGYTPNWCKKIFIVNKINDTVSHTYNLKDLNDEEIIGSFFDRELQKTKL